MQGDYLSSATIGPNTRHLFVERQHGHAFLFDVYGKIPNSQLVFLPGFLWNKSDLALQYLERSLAPQLKTLTFLTLGLLIREPNSSSWIDFLCRLEMPVFGIMHCFPIWPRGLYKAAKRITIIVLEESLANKLQEEHGIQNVICLPLHPTHSMYLNQDSKSVRKFMGVKPGQIVFSVLGGVRAGKGIELLMSAFSHLSPEDRAQAFFLFGGYSEDIEKSSIEKALVNSGCHGYVDLRKSIGTSSYYVALTEREFGQYVNAADIGLLFYKCGQREIMSGVLPDYVYARKPVIATSDSVVGDLVKKYDLGMVLKREEPREVANTIARALRAYRNGYTPTEAYESFRTMSLTDSVVQKFSFILNHPNTNLQQPRT